MSESIFLNGEDIFLPEKSKVRAKEPEERKWEKKRKEFCSRKPETKISGLRSNC